MSIVYIYGLVDPRNELIVENVRYVGKTEKKPQKRLNQHIINSKKNKTRIHRWILNLRKNNLKPKFLILSKCNENNWKLNEIKYISELGKTNDLLNHTKGGDGGATYHKEVYQYSEDGVLLKKYNSLNEIISKYGVKHDIISKVINQRQKKSYRGTYLFSSKENAKDFLFVKTKKDNIPIFQYSRNGEFIREYKSQREAVKITNIHQSNISYCLNGKRKHAGGFQWKHKNNI